MIKTRVISPFLQISIFLIISLAALVVNFQGTFILALMGCSYLLIQGKIKATLKWLTGTIILSAIMFVLWHTNYFLLALCGMIVTIFYKLLPALIFAVSLSYLPINKLRQTMNRLKVSARFQMMFIVGLRYFSILSSELHEIRQARLVHGLSFLNWRFIFSPNLLFEYSLVPTLMRTTKLIDELSVAAFTQGLINPYPKRDQNLVTGHIIDIIGIFYFVIALIVIGLNR